MKYTKEMYDDIDIPNTKLCDLVVQCRRGLWLVNYHVEQGPLNYSDISLTLWSHEPHLALLLADVWHLSKFGYPRT